MRFYLVILFLLPFLWIFPSTARKNVLKKDEELKYRDYMVQISRQLGVTCTYCHNVKDFKSSKKPTHKIARRDMRMIKILNEHVFNKKRGTRADCYMCHRGKALPDFKESSDKIR